VDLERVVAERGFTGVVRIDQAGAVEFERGYGFDLDTRLGIASGTKGLTAVVTASLVADGALALATPARALLGRDLPLIADDVTVEHLLAHRSGIGDYLDEDAGLDVEHWSLPVPPGALTTTADYLAVLGGFPAKFPAGRAFSYCNSGYAVLALLAERATGLSFYDLVQERVCEPAGMTATDFLPGDRLPPDAVAGRLADGRSNTANLPERGSGDGGIFTTVADVRAFWCALFAGRLVTEEWVVRLTTPQSERYGMGFWLDPPRPVAILEGCDAGVSFRSIHNHATDSTYTVIADTTDGAWPIARLLADLP
jgi:CubicO group peptidase (beta-lactamase class C family)